MIDTERQQYNPNIRLASILHITLELNNLSRQLFQLVSGIKDYSRQEVHMLIVLSDSSLIEKAKGNHNMLLEVNI